MKRYFCYVRVSTVKQGDGASLQAQRDAIEAYAERHDLTITEWFEEQETAAKRGWPVFERIVKAIRKGEADGLIVHKIDRSSRNMSDWARIGDLLDNGADVRFAHESLNMSSRGGRLTADIQAVIAADYVRNLREECLKGMDGRLRQGLFPFRAPIGYLDQGPGKPKTPDPERAPFVRLAFELYATQSYSLRGLLEELQRRGFRNRSGNPITKGCLENLLNNPFYNGEIYLKRTDRTYQGIHKPIISRALWARVQALKANRQVKKQTVHNMPYRCFVKCGHCHRSLCGELQKGRVYMRCQTKLCPTKAIREDHLEAELSTALLGLRLSPKAAKEAEGRFMARLKQRRAHDDQQAIKLQLSNLNNREEQLTDALLDQLIEKEAYQTRKKRLAEDRHALELALKEMASEGDQIELAQNFLELAKSLHLSHGLANPHQKRRIAEIAFSNRTLTGKNLHLEPQNWLSEVDDTLGVLAGVPGRDRTRTAEAIRELVDQARGWSLEESLALQTHQAVRHQNASGTHRLASHPGAKRPVADD